MFVTGLAFMCYKSYEIREEANKAQDDYLIWKSNCEKANGIPFVPYRGPTLCLYKSLTIDLKKE